LYRVGSIERPSKNHEQCPSGDRSGLARRRAKNHGRLSVGSARPGYFFKVAGQFITIVMGDRAAGRTTRETRKRPSRATS
jgi:hypothetical protein